MAAITLSRVDVSKQQCSILWFRKFMRLNGAGIIPTSEPKEYMPPRAALPMFFGPKCSSGFTFDNHGNLAYEQYVRELFRREMQLAWPVNSVMPFHFAGGLVAEALELEVNWAELAFKEAHLHLSTSGLPRLLEEYCALTEPLEPLTKINPVPNFKEQVAAAIYSDTEPWSHPTIPNAHVNPPVTTPPTPIAGDVKIVTPAALPPRLLPTSTENNSSGTRINHLSLSGLYVLWPGIMSLIDKESMRRRSERHLAFGPVARISLRLKEERERLKHISRNLAEKRESHDRAIRELEKSQGMLATARGKGGPARTVEEIDKMSLIKICESVVKSLEGNVEISSKRASVWAFKHHRQTIMVQKVAGELAIAETKNLARCSEIDKEVDKIVALHCFLTRL